MKLNGRVYSIIVGWGDRPTRFHDEKGNLVPFAGMLYLPDAILTTLLRKLFGYLPPKPWLSYRAQHRIAQILLPDWLVLEFGSGMSTAWLARRCMTLYSIEHDPMWYSRVTVGLSKRKINNVHYFLRDKEGYADLSDFPDKSFNFILIDGKERPACVHNAVKKLKRGGWIYLDNTDRVEKGSAENEYRQAEALLLDITQRYLGTFEYFTDFVPATSVVKQGMLIHL